ncbi:hypothetical protein GP486_003129 [Trichoglossum hirsutum]|uniref:Anthranilate synthase n=1 Tax=Trichoglossum hirsutum TaxID=265104 RepID=A0A9P8LDN8_9PEZI|nr:hypothetical protein GP486_003129 [Trichoglossum hirsutum]
MASGEENIVIQPSVEAVKDIFSLCAKASHPPNLVPIFASIPAEFLTPSAVYLKLSAESKSEFSFLLESAGTAETIGRYSFIGTDPGKVVETGPGYGPESDPLPILAAELSQYRIASIPSLKLPPLTGGAIGYVSYDCIRYFEPKTSRPLKDNLKIPESLFMLFNTIIAFDHFFSSIKIITNLRLPPPDSSPDSVYPVYEQASKALLSIVSTIQSTEIPFPYQPPIDLHQNYTSNVGRAGYESHVSRLKDHIIRGNIIQAVPSQRFSRPTSLHPFNIYRTLRSLNPSPYLFYMSCSTFHLVGASPELLIKTDGMVPLPTISQPQQLQSENPVMRPRVINHCIAGTIARGNTSYDDDRLARLLLSSEKDRAEHVMLVDLARNDINRVCNPLTVKVDRLMTVQRFSHVQHLTSEVSGVLRPECNRWDALRSVFPAGTVSGAPKVRAMELIGELEGETRGIYGGAAGWFGYDSVELSPTSSPHELQTEILEDGAMDTCIVIRAMLVKDGIAYMQAGGGIVYDSNEEEEWMETMNKLQASMRCVELAEDSFGRKKGAKSVEEVIEEERQKRP